MGESSFRDDTEFAVHRANQPDVLDSLFMSRKNAIGWVALGVVVIAAIIIAARYSRLSAPAARADNWNSSAIHGTLAGVRVREVDPTHAAVQFSYDLENRTDSDYRLTGGPNVVIMSRLQPSGSLSGDQPMTLDTNAFVPARNRTRISIEMTRAFAWPAQRDAAAERQIRQFVADEVSGLEGFVLFDQSTRYEIDLPAASPETQNGSAASQN